MYGPHTALADPRRVRSCSHLLSLPRIHRARTEYITSRTRVSRSGCLSVSYAPNMAPKGHTFWRIAPLQHLCVQLPSVDSPKGRCAVLLSCPNISGPPDVFFGVLASICKVEQEGEAVLERPVAVWGVQRVVPYLEVDQIPDGARQGRGQARLRSHHPAPTQRPYPPYLM